MFLSQLRIDVAHAPGRLWLRNLYRVHQRLCMAFPSNEQLRDDPDFLKPFSPGEFAAGHVHVQRHTSKGFLYRVDPQISANAPILVLSAIDPDWDYAFRNASHFLAAPPQVKEYNPAFAAGQCLRFRLAANATRRASKNSTDSHGKPVNPAHVGKRIPVPFDNLKQWLAAKGEKGGFAVDEVTVQSGYIYVNKKDENLDGKRLLAVRFDGLLRITDPQAFGQTIAGGIGPAKAFGFGLLSVAPVS